MLNVDDSEHNKKKCTDIQEEKTMRQQICRDWFMRNCNNLWHEWQIVSMNCRLSIFPLPDLPFSLSVSLIMNEIAQKKTKSH